MDLQAKHASYRIYDIMRHLLYASPASRRILGQESESN